MAPKKAKEPAAKAKEPAAKKAKVEEPKKEAPKAAPKKEEPKKEEPKKEEPKKVEEPEKKEEEPKKEEPSEKETDAAPDKRKELKESIYFDPAESTLNVVPTLGGKLLMTLTEGGLQHFIAGARASVGMKAGRYAFEVKAVQTLSTYFEKGKGGRQTVPKHFLRVGFSAGGSSLLLADGDGSVSFDAEGWFNTNSQRSPGAKFLERDMVVTLVLNLDPKSPNKDTISVFKNGERASEPKALPENLKGKVLYPHVSFRNVSVSVNFGPLMKDLPFKCRTLQSAAAADCEMNPITSPKDGKCELVLPVGFPNEGTFDWLDMYLEANPKYAELSDRKIQEWAKKSGLWNHCKWVSSRDKPEYQYGLPGMDDWSVTKMLRSIATVVPRDLVVMEVKSNLISEERKETLKKFNYPCFKKIAHVVMGEPAKDFKKVVHSKLLKDKQAKADIMWRAKKAENQRKKLVAARQKEINKAREAKEKEAKDKAKEKADAEKKKKGEEAKDGDAEMKAAEEAKEAAKEEEAKEEEKKEEEEEEEEKEPPAVELDEQELKVNFLPPAQTPDMPDYVLNAAFGNFTIPSKEEGFDVVRYEWQDADKSQEYMRKWILERKLVTKVDSLQPGEEFKKKFEDFQKTMEEWKGLQKEFKAKNAKKSKKDEKDDDEKKVDDVFTVENVKDLGNGEPLFGHFGEEDWALLTLRFEFDLLHKSFKVDANDPDREVIHETLLSHYYSLYYGKLLQPKSWGVDTNGDILSLIKDTAEIHSDKKVLVSTMTGEAETLDIFVKLTEETRRERQRRIDAGDETARLKFTTPVFQHVNQGGKAKGGKGTKIWAEKGKGAYSVPARGNYGKPYGKSNPEAP